MRSNHHKYKMLTETSMLTVLYSHNLMQNSANLVHMYCIHLYILKYGIYTKEHNYEDMCTKYCWICHFSRYTKNRCSDIVYTRILNRRSGVYLAQNLTVHCCIVIISQKNARTVEITCDLFYFNFWFVF